MLHVPKSKYTFDINELSPQNSKYTKVCFEVGLFFAAVRTGVYQKCIKRVFEMCLKRIEIVINLYLNRV